jgi:hypothetical protein
MTVSSERGSGIRRLGREKAQRVTKKVKDAVCSEGFVIVVRFSHQRVLACILLFVIYHPV